MPRVKPLSSQGLLEYNINKLSLDVEQELLRNRIKKKEVAELIGISPAAITQQFRNKKITIDTYIAVQMLVEKRENNCK